jgi:hypothetical protein
MNWKLITVILISLILLVVCYLTLDLQKHFQIKRNEQIQSEFFTNKKIKLDIQKEEDLKKFNIPDGHIIYYFPDKCPDYKSEFFLIDNENGLDKYYIPEEKHIILVKKDHRWTKQPDFIYWKFESLL